MPARSRIRVSCRWSAAALIFLVATVSAATANEFDRLNFADTQFEPVKWADLDGWAADDHAAALAACRASCAATGRRPVRDERPMVTALRAVCPQARPLRTPTAEQARLFFEENFHPLRIAKLGETSGLLTGYYEPIVEGSRIPTAEYAIPMYRRPADLVTPRRRAPRFVSPNRNINAPKSGVVRRFGRRAAPYYDRAQIENGALGGRHLEICWLKDPIDAFFVHIQGSARVRLDDGTVLGVNYAAQNG